MKYIIFCVIFIFITNWSQLWFFALRLIRKTVTKKKLKDKKILDIVKKKAGISLAYILVIQSKNMFGGMTGIPGRPFMMLSSELLDKLNPDELEYVLIHEAAHFKFHHPIITVFTQVALISIGIYLIGLFSTFISIVMAIFFSFLFLKTARIMERQAEHFAARHMKNPKAMISAVNKFEQGWSKAPLSSIKKFLSYNISYEEKREIAKKYIRT